MQKYAYKWKNAYWGGGNIGKKCHLFSSTFLSDPPNMPKWCKNYQNMHNKICKIMHKNSEMHIGENLTKTRIENKT